MIHRNWAQGLERSAIISSGASNSCLDHSNNHTQQRKYKKRYEALQKSPSNNIWHFHHTRALVVLTYIDRKIQNRKKKQDFTLKNC